MSRAVRENKLGGETSPYLLQHRHNPVDWHPWGEEALVRARSEGKPILLSVGYSACHWCHVMERECFEDPAIAEQMNRLYVCIKVDREERPDIDNLYQTTVQLQRRSGGWPLTVFLLPDGRPFYSGTYFPPEPRHGLPGFPQVLEQVHAAWATRIEEVDKAAAAITSAISRVQAPAEGPVGAGLVEDAGRFLLSRMDTEDGGFGDAPKFPSVPGLALLWRWATSPGDDPASDREAGRAAVRVTLDRMARGGMYDQIGGGWHRYSTDNEWLVPHFEKMLYDQALLVPIYVFAARAGAKGSGDLYSAAERACAWVLREMTTPEGLFYSATDADSEGVEGKFFVWSRREVLEVLGDVDGAAFCSVYDITERGNWEGHNIPRLKVPLAEGIRRAGTTADAIDRSLQRLFEHRAKRVAPALDDKAIVCWNALMVSALVAMGTGSNPQWLQAATRCADAIFSLFMVDGLLAHSRCKGRTSGWAFLDDHAALGLACLHLAEATGERRWLDRALGLADAIWAHFTAPEGYYQTALGGEPLFARPRDAHDSALPSGTGLAATFFLRLHAHTGDARWRTEAERVVADHGAQLAQNPFGSAMLLATLDQLERGFTEVVYTDPVLRDAAREEADPDTLTLALDSLPAGHPARQGRVSPSTAWLCRGTTCSLPVHDAASLRSLLRDGVRHLADRPPTQ